MWKETVGAQFKILSWLMPGGIDLYDEKPVRIDGDLTDIRTGHV
jgi:hypothetical protein